MAETLEFVFPPHTGQLQVILSKEALREVLRNEIRAQCMDEKTVGYKLTVKKEKYLYAICNNRGCRSCIRYTWREEGNFGLTKINSTHHHMVPSAKKHRFEAARAYIYSVPSSIPPSSLRHYVCNQFSLSVKQFYYILKTSRYRVLSIEEQVKQLEANGYQVYLSEEERLEGQLPQIMMVFNQQMIKDFERYGDLVSFDLTFNMVKNGHVSGHRWKVGCFLGMSSAKHIVPLGFTATLFQTKQVYTQLFKTFFKVMGRSPRVIVTDQERAIHAALVQLKDKEQFRGLHLFDCFHILQNIKKRLKVKENLRLFKQLVHARNKPQFERRVRETRVKLDMSQLPVLERFLDRSQLYCFSQINGCFIGFSSSSSPNEALHSLLKAVQPSQKDYCCTVTTILRYLQHLQQRTEQFQLQLTPYEKFYGLPELRTIRHTISKPIFSKLIEEVAKSIRCEVAESDQDLRDQNVAYLKEHYAVFKMVRGEQGWRCECGYSQRAGLPCRHLLRYLILAKQPIYQYLSDRWISKEPLELPMQTVTGREKSSKRSLWRKIVQ